MPKSNLTLLPVCLGLLAYSPVAGAVVVEPDGMQVPLPLSEDVTQEVVDCCGVAADGSNMSLEALFAYRGESIHWQNDAATEPSSFSPLCRFRGSLILRGGGCQVDFGWYNVDLGNPSPPPDDLIYPLVTTADVAAWFQENNLPANNDNAFHPAVGERPIEGALIEDLRGDPRYLDGLIGLATKGNDIGGTCVQAHYSEPRLNQMSVHGEPWIMAVVYRSTATANAFYIGFEDLPTDPDNFRKPTPPPEEYQNDADFNDFVYFVEGITCEGGGQPCLLSAEGACGFGLTECQPDGTVVCVAQLQESAELCDNIDNDCNGLVDDGELCSVGEVCDKGVCKPYCSATEFPCASPLVCDSESGLCIDPACLGVDCPPGQVCLGGECVGGCNNVVCPWGQVCQLGRCVDPCRNRTCEGDMVCEGGVCIDSCHCRMCAPGLTCDYATGRCIPPGCETVTCPANEVCLAGLSGGECVNKCNNVICPGGASCDPTTGECGEPLPGHTPSSEDWTIEMLPDGGLVRSYPDGRLEAVRVLADGGLEVVAILDPDGGIPAQASRGQQPAEPGCGCRIITRPTAAGLAAGGLLLLGLALRRLRRPRRRSGKPARLAGSSCRGFSLGRSRAMPD
jgi:hypothetical protein